MPLTGYELFANDVAITEQVIDHAVVEFTSGNRGVALRMSRATGTKLKVLIEHWLACDEGAEVLAMLP